MARNIHMTTQVEQILEQAAQGMPISVSLFRLASFVREVQGCKPSTVSVSKERVHQQTSLFQVDRILFEMLHRILKSVLSGNVQSETSSRTLSDSKELGWLDLLDL